MIDRTVAYLNVEHYRKLLHTELDETKRQTICRLLVEEEKKLAAFLDSADGPAQDAGAAPRRRKDVSGS